MAVVNIREVYPGVSLGLWQMDETVEQLFEQYSHLQAYRSQLEEKYKNDGRKLEFLAIRALMYEMLKTNGASKGLLSHAGDITHNEAGKPLFRGYHISVSHTKGYSVMKNMKKLTELYSRIKQQERRLSGGEILRSTMVFQGRMYSSLIHLRS